MELGLLMSTSETSVASRSSSNPYSGLPDSSPESLVSVVDVIDEMVSGIRSRAVIQRFPLADAVYAWRRGPACQFQERREPVNHVDQSAG